LKINDENMMIVPEATPMKELVAFMTASCNEENILFYAGVDSFRKQVVCS
jgi:hypothetical protein